MLYSFIFYSDLKIIINKHVAWRSCNIWLLICHSCVLYVLYVILTICNKHWMSYLLHELNTLLLKLPVSDMKLNIF